MIATLAANTFRECVRRAFPYVAVLCVVALALGSKLFLAFSFGAASTETVNVGISAVFLAGFVVAAFLGTTLTRRDLERGTLGLLLTKPVSLASYVTGRFIGLAATSAVVCSAVALTIAAVFGLLDPDSVGAPLAAGCARAILPVLVLDAAALAASAVGSRVGAPLMLFALFLGGALLRGVPFIPDFSLFGLEAGAAPSIWLLLAYTTIYASIFVLLAFILLARQQPLRQR